MADINTITQQVIDREQQRIESELREYQTQLSQEFDQKKNRAKEEFEAQLAKLETDKRRQFDISLNSIDLKQRNQRLAAKQDVIHTYVDDVLQAMSEMSSQETLALVQGVLSQVGQRDGIKVIFTKATREKLADQLMSLKEAGYQIQEDTIEEGEGFIIVEGSHQYNYLYNNLIEDVRPELQRILVDQLFK